MPQDTAFDLLSNGRRRFVLRRLQRRRDGVELSDLAEELAAAENDLPADELSAQQRKRTYVSLYQTHIPKLADAGVVDYDSDSGMVYPTRHVDELAQYFEEDREEIDWPRIYAVVATVGFAVYGLSAVVDVPFLTPLYVGLLVLSGLVIVAGAHYVYAERAAANGARIPIENE
ncbi:DUF7344 domain-containing protein [Halobellus sp. GM3]|uniref:DUF7344 domain-containing protein n=1 Tax=Halobellus sp. GM3 TaxID=3458410 RepID=UPI00403DF78E